MTKRMTLRTARHRAVMTQYELALKAGVGYSTPIAIEHGRKPQLSTIRLLAAALEVDPRDIAWPGNPLGLENEEDAA